MRVNCDDDLLHPEMIGKNCYLRYRYFQYYTDIRPLNRYKFLSNTLTFLSILEDLTNHAKNASILF